MKEIVRTLPARVRATVHSEGLLRDGDAVVLGFSGGPDSLCLFDILCRLAPQLRLRLTAVHVHHGLRPGAADEDQRFVEEQCRRHGIPCRVERVDCRRLAAASGEGVEETGRRVRYAAFARAAAALTRDGLPAERVRIAVAQNRDDQAETLLFRLLRGSGLDGLAGMPYRRRDASGFTVVRPLLEISRAEIEAYCAARGLAPRRDLSNDDPHYMRNRIRHRLLPELEAHYNPGVREALLRLSRTAREDSDCLRQAADRVWPQALYRGERGAAENDGDTAPESGAAGCGSAAETAVAGSGDGTPARGAEPDEPAGGICRLRRAVLRQQPAAIRHRLLQRALQRAGLERDLGRDHLEQMDGIITGTAASAAVDLPHGYRCRVSYELVICAAAAADRIPPATPQQLRRRVLPRREAEDLIAAAAAGTTPGNRAIFDADLLAAAAPGAGGALPEIVLRRRAPGDYIALRPGRRRIQDLFVDMKVPREVRDRILLAAAGSEVLWIPAGYCRARCSGRYRTGPETARVLVLEMVKEV